MGAWWRTVGITPMNPGSYPTYRVEFTLKDSNRHSYKRNLWVGHRVSDMGATTGRTPAEQTAWGEASTSNLVRSGGDLELVWIDLKDLRSTILIEDLGVFEIVRPSLAINTLTDQARSR